MCRSPDAVASSDVAAPMNRTWQNHLKTSLATVSPDSVQCPPATLGTWWCCCRTETRWNQEQRQSLEFGVWSSPVRSSLRQDRAAVTRALFTMTMAPPASCVVSAKLLPHPTSHLSRPYEQPTHSTKVYFYCLGKLPFRNSSAFVTY